MKIIITENSRFSEALPSKTNIYTVLQNCTQMLQIVLEFNMIVGKVMASCSRCTVYAFPLFRLLQTNICEYEQY
jgi:hypothetical protein